MSAKIDRIALHGFRGATQPVEIVFDSTRPVALIFGENGTGKSTIADALDFICNRRFGSLEDRSIRGQAKTYLPSLGGSSAGLKVTVTSGTNVWTASLTKDGASVTPPGCPNARVLRRSHLLQLLEATPKERFQVIREFIDVPGIEKSENALTLALKEIRTGYDDATRATVEAQEAIERLWDQAGKKGESARQWARAEIAQDLDQLREEVRVAGEILSALDSAEQSRSASDRANADLATALVAEEDARQTLKSVQSDQMGRNAALLGLLKDTRNYVAATAEPSSAPCPVCDRPMESGVDLLALLDQRIGEMHSVAVAIDTEQRAHKRTETATTLATKGREDYCSCVRQVARLARPAARPEAASQFDPFLGFVDGDATDEAATVDASALLALIVGAREALAMRRSEQAQTIQLQNIVASHLKIWREKRQAAETLQKLSDQLEVALEIVSRHRKDYVEKILTSISGSVETLYTKLHPGEPLGGVRFYLKPKMPGSLEFDGQFGGKKGVPPGAYYSESHLDTLGICIFLALSGHFQTGNTLLVLDDVVTSIDHDHLDRFVDLLHDEAPKFTQVIITTHYRPWKDRYRYARGPAAKTHLIELRSWKLAAGVQCEETVGLLGELRRALSLPRFERDTVGQKAGVQLESLLDFVTHLYGCRLPRQSSPNYTLGALRGGINKQLGAALKTNRPVAPTGLVPASRTEITLKPLIDAAVDQSDVRNRVGCHFNHSGSELSDANVRAFGDAVLLLSEAMICEDCGSLPKRQKSGSFHECQCGKVQMHPLEQPQ